MLTVSPARREGWGSERARLEPGHSREAEREADRTEPVLRTAVPYDHRRSRHLGDTRADTRDPRRLVGAELGEPG